MVVKIAALKDGEEVAAGRSLENGVVCEHGATSRIHAIMRREGKFLVLLDRGSRNGIFVNGQRKTFRASDSVQASPGDVVSLGSSSREATFRMPEFTAGV